MSGITVLDSGSHKRSYALFPQGWNSGLHPSFIIYDDRLSLNVTTVIFFPQMHMWKEQGHWDILASNIQSQMGSHFAPVVCNLYTQFRKMGFNSIVFHSLRSFILLGSAVTMVTLSERFSDMPFFPHHISSSLFSHSVSFLIMSSSHIWRSKCRWNYPSVTSNQLCKWWWCITVVLVYK